MSRKDIAEKKRLARLRALLKSRDLAGVTQGLELLQSLGDPVLYDALLRGTTYIEDSDRSRLKGRGFTGPMTIYGLTGLLAQAPADSRVAAALRPKITTLSLSGLRSDASRPVSPRFLAGLPDLSELALYRLGPILPEKPNWPQLRRLYINALLRTPDFSWLSGASRLEELHIHETPSVDLPGLVRSRLRHLKMYRVDTVDLSGLAGGRLESLTILGAKVVTGWSAVAGMETLRILEGHGALPEDLRPFASDALRELAVSDRGALSGLEALTALEALHLHSDRPESYAAIPSGVRKLTARGPLQVMAEPLKRLRLVDVRLYLQDEVLPDVPEVGGSLVKLALEHCTLRSLTGLAAHPDLEELAVTVAPGTDPAPLLALTKLKSVSIRGIRLDGMGLEARGVHVFYPSR